jgi:3-hydroxybutyryl-CoA dehydrogenase
MQIKTVGVLGCGLMGSGIAQVCAASGYKTIVREVNDQFLDRGLGRIRKFLDDGVAKGKVAGLEEKKQTYAALEGCLQAHTLFVSNTSSLCITELAASTKRPDKFAGLHFFNPVPIMKLVEVIRALTTSDETYDAMMRFAQSLGKEPITAPDRPGFIVNRLLVPYLLDAVRAYENGLGTLEDIDKGMKLGCGYPMGPFTLLDFVGLDTTYYIANIMFEEFREPAYAPPPLLKRMVLAGRLGKKSGRGFYSYDR